MNKLLPLAVLLLASCGAPPASRQAADFTLNDMSGNSVTLSALRGRPVFLNFWATWCDTCKEELPVLEDLHRRLSKDGLVILGASMDDEPFKAVPPFAKKHGLTFALLAADRKTSADYAVRGLPASFLIDADGVIVRRWLGPLDPRAVENDILAQLNRRPR